MAMGTATGVRLPPPQATPTTTETHDDHGEGVTVPATIPLLGLGWDDALFLGLAGAMLLFALLVVSMRDIIRCGLAMMAAFGALAGLYVLANAPVVAAAQVLIYIGAISVLILFAIMLTQSKVGTSALVFQTQARWAALAAVVLAILLALTVVATSWPGGASLTEEQKQHLTENLATTLFTDYVLPFEIVSVLLLAAVIGGVFLAKRERGDDD
jgi:NADH-quinone oxidoreductase subunit J